MINAKPVKIINAIFVLLKIILVIPFVKWAAHLRMARQLQATQRRRPKPVTSMKASECICLQNMMIGRRQPIR